MGYCLYRPQPFEAGPGAESVRSVADSCWSRIKGRDKVELKLGCGNYDPQTPPSTLDSISLKDYPDRLLEPSEPSDGEPAFPRTANLSRSLSVVLLRHAELVRYCRDRASADLVELCNRVGFAASRTRRMVGSKTYHLSAGAA